MTMQNDQNHGPGFLESAMGNGKLVVVAIIAVVFFNYFKARIRAYNQEMIVAANQLAEMLHFHNSGEPIPTDIYQPLDGAARVGAPAK